MTSFFLLLLLSVLLSIVTPTWTQDLRSVFAGSKGSNLNISFVLPGEPTYVNFTRPFNLRFDFEPAAVAFPNTVQEVAEILKIGQAIDHQVVARSGGHSYIANGLGGKNGTIVIDLRNFNTITVDDDTNTAVIEAGNRLGDIVTALASHGRGLPHGTCPYIGLGGHAAFGGFGFTSRLWGLTLDAILSIQVVLANGRVTTASETQNPDLFWALRGSGSSFGITTSITFRTFPAPPTATIFSYNWHLTATEAASAISAYQSFALLTASLPPEFGAEIIVTRGDFEGMVNIGFAGGFYLPVTLLNDTLKPFLDNMPSPMSASFDTGDYLHSATNLAGGSLNTNMPDHTNTFYAKSLMTPEDSPMSMEALTAFANVVANEGFTTTTGWFFQIDLFGGPNSAINAVPSIATAFVHRTSLFTIQFYASSPGGIPPYPQEGFAYLDNCVNAIINNSPSGSKYGAYTNYIDDMLPDWQDRYYAQNYPRLQHLKGIFDPRGTFTFPTSIQPL